MDEGPDHDDEGRELWEYRFGEPPLSGVEEMLADAPDEVSDLPYDLQAGLHPQAETRHSFYDQQLVDLPELGHRRFEWEVVVAWAAVVAGLLLMVFAYSWGRHVGQGEGTVVPGRIDVEFLAESDVGSMTGLCDWMGGELIFSPQDRTYVCEDVDT